MGEADIYKKILDKIKINGIKEDNTSVLDLIKANKELQQRIDKAIEYIENHKLDRKQNTTTILDSYTMQERDLLNILRGEDK